MSDQATTVILVRHGETSANTERVWHGSTDTALSDRGWEQARRVARHLAEAEPPATALYTSHLQRASNTAREIGKAQSLLPRIDRGVAEYHLGAWEGRRFRDLLVQEDFWTRIHADPDFAPAEGESVRQVADRFADSMRKIAETHPGERVIVVSHGGAMALGLGWLIDGQYSSLKRMMDNCAISELILGPKPRLARLARLNDSAHLAGVELVDPRDLSGDAGSD